MTRAAVRGAGGVVVLAAKLGITKSAVSQWDKVPAEHVLAVEDASGVSRHVLRPDVFGPPPDTTAVRRPADAEPAMHEGRAA